MSARIGEVLEGAQAIPIVIVSASLGGVELMSHGRRLGFSGTITPIEARNFAALLVRGADECERMRAHEGQPPGVGP